MAKAKKKKDTGQAMQRGQQTAPNAPARQSVNSIQISASASFSGPIPPPHILAEYENVLPGTVDRIISMAEEEGNHRRAQERLIIQAEIATERRGMYFSWSLVVLLAGIGSALLFAGKELGGWVTLLVAIGSLVTNTISRHLPTRKSDGTKDGEDERQLKLPNVD